MGRKKHPDQDQNFDGLTQKFQRNIYDTMKGKLRLAILQRDFAEHVPRARRVLDVGAGQGQWALEMLRRGDCVTLTDISQEMLQLAQQEINGSDLSDDTKASVQYHHCALQNLVEHVQGDFDVIVCHAVMEWLDQPQSLFDYLQPFMHPGSLLSIIFYNRNGLIFKNMLRTNYKKILAQDFRGSVGSFTPLNPLDANEVLAWAQSAGFDVVCHSGIRVFHDYILTPGHQDKNHDQVMALELEYSRKPPFRDLGRYVHFLLRKQ